MKTFIMFDNGIWRVSAYRSLVDGKLSLKVESLKTGFVDWPFRYDDGHVVYDFPERLPTYIRRTVNSIFNPSRNQWASLADIERWHLV